MTTRSGAKKVSRATAIKRGLTRYFTGKPCKRGHVCERLICNRHCVECKRVCDASPPMRGTHRRYRTSPLGIESKRCENASPKGRDRHRRYNMSPKGLAKQRERHATDRYRKNSNRWYRTPAVLKRERKRDRERYLDRALDTTRDDFSPVRAANLLARWNARL